MLARPVPSTERGAIEYERGKPHDNNTMVHCTDDWVPVMSLASLAEAQGVPDGEKSNILPILTDNTGWWEKDL